MKELFLFSKIKKQKSTGDLLARGVANKPKRENYVRNVLLIIEIEEAELASTLSLFKEYFDSRTILKATSDGLIYYVGIPSTDKGFFLKKVLFIFLFICLCLFVCLSLFSFSLFFIESLQHF